MCQHSFYVTHILHIYWKLSQGTRQTILVRLMTQIQFVFAFSLSSYLPTNKRAVQRAHKIKNTQRHSCISLSVLHRTIAQISWFQEPAHSEKHSRSLETEPSVGILLFVLFTWKWWPLTIHVQLTTVFPFVLLIATKLLVVSYSNSSSLSGRGLVLTYYRNLEKLNFIHSIYIIYIYKLLYIIYIFE